MKAMFPPPLPARRVPAYGARTLRHNRARGANASPLPQLRGVLSVLPVRAREPDLPAAALRRHDARLRLPAPRVLDAELLVAARRPGMRLCVRLGRPLLLRKEPSRHLHLPVLQLPR